jgi:hypothetical protein
MKKYLFSLVFIVSVGLASCVNLKPYERVYVNDPEMQMESDAGRNFEYYVQGIREGAFQAGTGKASGGCGCN